MKFRVLSTVGAHDTGAIVTEEQLRGPERAAELVKRGIVEAIDGMHPAPLDEADAKGWQKRCKALEDENKKLRTATPEARHVARITEVEAELEALKAEHAGTVGELAELRETGVPLAQYKNLSDQHEQLKHLHASTVKELESLHGGKKKSKDVEVPEGAEAVDAWLETAERSQLLAMVKKVGLELEKNGTTTGTPELKAAIREKLVGAS